MQDLFRSRKFWLTLGMSLVVPFFMATAQDDDYEDDEDEEEEQAEVNWKDKRAEIMKLIDAEVDKQIKATISHEKIVALIGPKAAAFEASIVPELRKQREHFHGTELKKWDDRMIEATYPKFAFDPKPIPGWSWPIADPQKTPEKIKDELCKKMEGIFVSAYPMRSVETMTEEGHKKYPLYQDVDARPRVSFKLRGGRGVNTKVDGKLQKLNSERLQVSGRWVSRKDLDLETQSMFYKDVNDAFVADYVEDEIRKYNVMKESFILDWCDYLLPESLMLNGYIPNNYLETDENTGKYFTNIRFSSNSKKWVSRKDYEKKIYTSLYNIAKKKIAPAIEKDFFEHAEDKELYSENFEFVKELNEWMPISEADSYREEQERKLREKENPMLGPGGGLGNPLDPGMGNPLDPGMAMPPR